MSQPFPDGIHFGLPEEPYHADTALGSTDLKALSIDPAAWWWGSGHNPLRPEPEEEKAHRLVGRAVHKLVLEGPAAFADLYSRYPEGDDLLVTADHLAAWIKDRGGKVPASKALRIAAILEFSEIERVEPPRILDLILQEAAAGDRTGLGAVGGGDPFSRRATCPCATGRRGPHRSPRSG